VKKETFQNTQGAVERLGEEEGKHICSRPRGLSTGVFTKGDRRGWEEKTHGGKKKGGGHHVHCKFGEKADQSTPTRKGKSKEAQKEGKTNWRDTTAPQNREVEGEEKSHGARTRVSSAKPRSDPAQKGGTSRKKRAQRGRGNQCREAKWARK